MGEPAVNGRPALTVTGLDYAYPDGTRALYGVDLVVRKGERIAVLGPNGAGKSTLVLHLNGILEATRGSVRVGDVTVGADTLAEVRRRVGLVFQDPDDQLFMPRVHADVAFGAQNMGLRGSELDDRVEEALSAVGMLAYADRPPHHLSLGQRRRVAIATVLVMRPDILVLDEPTSNLDPAGRVELTEVLRSLSVTTVIVTHDLPYALQLCDRSVLLDAGVVVADTGTRALLMDTELLRAHRLALPYGFDPASAGDG